MTTTRARTILLAIIAAAIAAASIAASYRLAFGDVTINVGRTAPAVGTSSTVVAAPDCYGAVDDTDFLDTATAAAIDHQIARCDYRTIGGPCYEDAWCAVAVINDTDDYPGHAATLPGAR